MSNISQWSNSAGGNTAATPNGWPEGQPASSVNDCAREMMGATRRWYEDAEWINRGDSPTFLTTASFSIPGDQRTPYHIGRRIKAYDASVLYGKISDVTYSANTRINVTLNTGQLSSSLTGVAVGILSFTNQSIPEVSATASYARSAGYASSGIADSLNVQLDTTVVTSTSSLSLSMGSVTVGDIISVAVHHGFAYGTSTRDVFTNLSWTGATLSEGGASPSSVNMTQFANASGSTATGVNIHASGMFKVTAGGNLVFNLNSGALTTTGYSNVLIGLHAFCIKKQ